MTDPFSDILKLANAKSVVSGGFTVGGAWSISFPPPTVIKLFGVMRGFCWLQIDGEAAPVRIEQGDIFMLSSPRPFTLASDMTIEPAAARTLFANHGGRIVKVSESDETFVIGGHVHLDAASGGLLADVLPPLLHVRADSSQATTLQWLMQQLVTERSTELPGAAVASTQLAQLVFIQFLRAYISETTSLPAGWLRALGDARLAPALRLMHGDPSRSWQLEELAKAVAMSRTTFAARFKTAAGVPPLTYLSNWRMRIAERTLRDGNTPVSTLALSLGYTSESAFSNAFKRIIGMAPRRYRDAARASLPQAAVQTEL
jgi:AraC-like DNA-binding protein